MAQLRITLLLVGLLVLTFTAAREWKPISRHSDASGQLRDSWAFSADSSDHNLDDWDDYTEGEAVVQFRESSAFNPYTDRGFHVEFLDLNSGNERAPVVKSAPVSKPASVASVLCSEHEFEVTLPVGPLSEVKILGSNNLLPVFDAPESCGYTLTQGHNHNTLIVLFSGCHVRVQAGRHMLRVLYVNEAEQMEIATVSCEAKPESSEPPSDSPRNDIFKVRGVPKSRYGFGRPTTTPPPNDFVTITSPVTKRRCGRPRTTPPLNDFVTATSPVTKRRCGRPRTTPPMNDFVTTTSPVTKRRCGRPRTTPPQIDFVTTTSPVTKRRCGRPRTTPPPNDFVTTTSMVTKRRCERPTTPPPFADPVITPPPPIRPHGCNIPHKQQLPCGCTRTSKSECEEMGCCVNSATSACYYPMNVCTADKQFVFAIKKDITSPPLDVTKLIIPGHPRCRPVVIAGKTAIFKFSVRDCGTRSYQVGQSMIYMAEVQTAVRVLNLKYGIITRDNPVRVIVECRYPIAGSSSQSSLVSVGYMVMSPSSDVPAQLTSQGLFGVELRIAKDQTYTTFYPHHHQPLKLLLGKPVYLELRLRSPKPEAVLLVNYCLAYPRSAKNALVLIYEGCANPYDPTIAILKVVDLPQDRHKRRFVVNAFQFMNHHTRRYMNEEIYFMCSTELCMPREKTCVESCFDDEATTPMTPPTLTP